jgi:hypothetical protein
MRFTLQPAVTKAATFSGAGLFASRHLRKVRELIITLNITVAERDSGNETYDFYITTGDGVSSWDLVHFAQIASTGAKTLTARIVTDLQPGTVTTAAPGVAAVESGTLATIASATNAVKSLAAGLVRHGPIGDRLGYELVVAGTVATGIAYSILVEGRR